MTQLFILLPTDPYYISFQTAAEGLDEGTHSNVMLLNATKVKEM
jgi:hypothetical protein